MFQKKKFDLISCEEQVSRNVDCIKIAKGLLQRNLARSQILPVYVDVDRKVSYLKNTRKLLQKQIRVAHLDKNIYFRPMAFKLEKGYTQYPIDFGELADDRNTNSIKKISSVE